MIESGTRRPAMQAMTLALAAAVLAGCSAAYEPFTAEGEAEQPNEGLVKGIMMSLGAVDPNDKPIEYRPRAPLVMPPKSDLRAPEDTDAALAGRQFPTNPEDRRGGRGDGSTTAALTLAEQEKFANLPRITSQRPQLSPEEASRPLRPDLLAGDPAIRAAAVRPSAARARSLTAPPAAYATPNPNVPFEEEKEKEASWKPTWWPF